MLLDFSDRTRNGILMLISFCAKAVCIKWLSLEDSISWTRMRSFQRSPALFSWPQTWLAINHWLWGTKVGLRNHEEVPQTIPGPFAIDSSGDQTNNPHFTSRGIHQILSQKDLLEAVGLLLWLGARRHRCRCRKYYICPATLHQPPNDLPNLGCSCIRGYAMTQFERKAVIEQLGI